MGNPFIFVVRFLKEVNVEMKKVTWLNKNQLVEYTILVIVISVVVGIYLGALDFVFQEAFEWVLDQFESNNTTPTTDVPVDTSTTSDVSEVEQTTNNETEQTTDAEQTDNN